VDADSDGFDSTVDCDDNDPNVFPGGTETWYDGVDQDCAGDDDQDQDGDGFPRSEDCDDTAATVHPSAVESSGDGVDSDCDGADGPRASDPAQSIAPFTAVARVESPLLPLDELGASPLDEDSPGVDSQGDSDVSTPPPVDTGTWTQPRGRCGCGTGGDSEVAGLALAGLWVAGARRRSAARRG